MTNIPTRSTDEANIEAFARYGRPQVVDSVFTWGLLLNYTVIYIHLIQ